MATIKGLLSLFFKGGTPPTPVFVQYVAGSPFVEWTAGTAITNWSGGPASGG